jgi:hypothetical protein
MNGMIAYFLGILRLKLVEHPNVANALNLLAAAVATAVLFELGLDNVIVAPAVDAVPVP